MAYFHFAAGVTAAECMRPSSTEPAFDAFGAIRLRRCIRREGHPFQ